MKAVDAAEPEEILVDAPGQSDPTDWSPDGRFILYSHRGDTTVGQGRDLWALPLERPRKPFPVLTTRFHETGAQFSLDGQWIAYQSNASGRPEIYVQPFSVPPRVSHAVPVSNGGGVQARWGADGKELFYLAPDNWLMRVSTNLDARTGKVDVGTPVRLFETHVAGPQFDSSRQYMVSKDGQRFLIDTAKEVSLPITVVLNWQPPPP